MLSTGKTKDKIPSPIKKRCPKSLNTKNTNKNLWPNNEANTSTILWQVTEKYHSNTGYKVKMTFPRQFNFGYN